MLIKFGNARYSSFCVFQYEENVSVYIFNLWLTLKIVLVNIFMFNCLILIKQNVCIDCAKMSLCQICMRNAWFHRNGGCEMHGFTGMVGAECTVSTVWWERNALFNRNDGCSMLGPTGVMGAQCKVLPGWWVRNARSYRGDGCAMQGPTGMMGAQCMILPG